MPFQVNKQHKLQDQIENLCYEWAYEDVIGYFNVESIEDLTQEQIDEIYTYSESDESDEGMVGVILRSMCGSMCEQWEN
jgi:hypothetical protein